MEIYISHHSRPDFPLIGGRIPLDLQKIAAMPGGQACVETVNTRRKFLVTASRRWVKIVPDLPFTGLSPEVFVNVCITRKNIIDLAVYTKNLNGEYFDTDFRAKPLTYAAVEFLVALNPDVEGIAFQYIQGSDTYSAYEYSKKRFLAQEIKEEEARRQALRELWDYVNIAIPLGFTEIDEKIEEKVDPVSGFIEVNGIFRRQLTAGIVNHA